jgi:Bacterial SCP ortholog
MGTYNLSRGSMPRERRGTVLRVSGVALLALSRGAPHQPTEGAAVVSTKPIDATQLRAALVPVLDWLDGTAEQPPRPVLATAVRTSLRAFAQHYPGKAVEVRVPPFAAVQCLPGGAHTRGTPPHVVETDPRVWLALATGRLDWATAVAQAAVSASGHRAEEIGALLPLGIATRIRNSE